MGIYREGSMIGDRVFFDELNGVSNGIQDAGEVGANDIKVTLYAADGTELKSTRTNVSGEYHFTNVLAGRYTVGFSELPTGYVFASANQGNDDEKDSDVNANGRTDVIVVNGHVNITSIDAGLKKVSTGISASDIKSGITGQNVTLDVLANDTEGTFNFDISTVRLTSVPDGATLSEDGRTLTVPNEGVWSVNPDTGAITFTPADGFIGDPTPIAYTVEDTEGNETGADVEVNYPPLAVDDNVNAQTGTQVIIYVLENDANTSSPLDVTSVRLIDPISGDEVETLFVVNEGTWSINIDGSVTFTPDAGFVNTPTAIQYVVREIAGDVSNRATITIIYPDAVDDTVIVPVGTTGEIIVNVAENDSNNTIATTVTIGCEQAGTDTLVVQNEGSWSVGDGGIIIFTPEAGFIGEPTDIQYTIALVSGERSNCATVDIRRELLAVDDKSTLNVGSVTLINILSNDFGSLNAQSVRLVLPVPHVAGSTLSNDGKVLTVPSEGVWSVNDLGIVSFTAEEGFTSAPTPIKYIVENNNGLLSNVANIILTEGGVSVVANDDSGTANAGNPVVVSVLDNDTGDLNRSSVRIITPNGDEVTTYVVAGEGTWTVGENGNITFTGESGFVGTPTPIRYIVSDNSVIVLSDTATVTIHGTRDCRPYETSIPAMGKLSAFTMLILTLLITMLFFREEKLLVK
jgi:CshA-type fibril repeat protein